MNQVTYYYSKNTNSSSYNNNRYNINNITIDDLEHLNLLEIQANAAIMYLISDFLSYISTIESMELIYNKYDELRGSNANPDIPAVGSAFFAIIAAILFSNISFTRYNSLYEKYINGEINYSLDPNIQICIGNVFSVIAKVYILIGALGIYERDITQPIFGV